MSEHAQATTPAPAAKPPQAAAAGGALQDPLAASELPSDAAAGAETASMGKAEIAIYLLEQMEQGDADPMSSFQGAYKAEAAAVMATIQKQRALVDRCIQQGVQSTNGELIKPAPAHAIAGFLGIAPKDPGYKAPE